jgi:tetratricopeptide (TPR) repeat protein
MVRLGELASQRGDAPGSAASATDPASDAADSVSEEPAASDIGDDLANWDEGFDEGEAQESDEQPSAVDAGALAPDGPSDSADTEIEWVDTADALDGAEEIRVDEESAAAESDLAADLGLDDSTDLGFEAEVDDGDSASADEQDEMGELPGEPVVTEPSEGLESPVEVSSEAPVGPVEASEDGDDLGFDLAAELSQSIDQGPGASSGTAARGDTLEDGFASVFAEFKKGVSETLTEGDHQAHYDLGIAYREMGLLNDAVTEFRLAMEAPERRIGCLHLMGMCAHDMGEPEQAIGHFTEALTSGEIEGQGLLALKLELGKSHESVGDNASARREYEEVHAVDSDFADVASRLDELEKSEEVEPQVRSVSDTDEYETFEEFLGEFDEPDPDEPEAEAASTGEAEKAPVWESFDDIVAELDSEDTADSASGEPEAAAPAEPVSEAEGSEPAEETETTPKRRKKKISFI